MVVCAADRERERERECPKRLFATDALQVSVFQWLSGTVFSSWEAWADRVRQSLKRVRPMRGAGYKTAADDVSVTKAKAAAAVGEGGARAFIRAPAAER